MPKIVCSPPYLYYKASFLDSKERQVLLNFLESLVPLWEFRYSQHRPLPPGEEQRELLRPVYWLGAWQFACLDYYRPPKGALYRCLKSPDHPPFLAQKVRKMESIARLVYPSKDIPPGWELNTCLVNFYGDKLVEGKWIDTARVGEHKDFEPGPVASLSLGERGLFQFVLGDKSHQKREVLFQKWLEDSSLLLFGGPKWKNQSLHRVQRVENKNKDQFIGPAIDRFRTRRINLTFRYVPKNHIHRWDEFPPGPKKDVEQYVQEMIQKDPLFRQLMKEGEK